ncbi:CBS domain-containing protein [Nocardiopsis coralliicola]
MATTAREIMTADPRCIGTDDTLAKAAEFMARDGVGALPVCGQDGKLKGLITDRDITVRAVAEGKDPATATAGGLNQGEAVTIGADDPVETLFQTLVRHRVKRLPVIDGSTLVGIVAMSDVARVLPEPDTGDLVAALSAE